MLVLMSSSSAQTTNLNKTWIVYNTTDNSHKGWHTFMNNYILDFSDGKTLFIKTLGDKQIVEIPYRFNSENGILFEEGGEILYVVQKLSPDRLILKMGENSTTIVSLTPLARAPLERDVISLIKSGIWQNGLKTIQFLDEQYNVAGEIGTNFKTFVEKNKSTKSECRGAWLLDSYKEQFFIELYSEELNYKSIYQIESISDKNLRAVSTDKFGHRLQMELSSK